MKKIIGLFAAAALAFGVIGCTNDDLNDGEYLTRDSADEGATGNYSVLKVLKSFTVTKDGAEVSSISVDKGSSATLTLSEKGCTVEVEDTKIATATLSETSLSITGKKAGSTTVYVLYSENLAASIDVTVVSTGVVSAQATFSGLATQTDETTGAVDLSATLTDDDELLTSASDLAYSVEDKFGTVTSPDSNNKLNPGYNTSVIGGSAGYKVTGNKDNEAIAKGDLLGYFYTTITAKEDVKIDTVSFTIGSSSFAVTGKVVVAEDEDNIEYTSSTSSTSGKASTGTISDIGVSISAGESKIVAVAVYADNTKKAAGGINFGISALDVKVVEASSSNSGSGDVTTYTVVYNGTELTKISATEFNEYKDELTEGTDYTISGSTITLTESGYAKVTSD